MKTSELTGAALDWAVAKCESNPVAMHSVGQLYLIATPWADKTRVKWIAEYSPTKHWAQGGPIIERERIAVAYEPSLVYDDSCRWKALAAMSDNDHEYGPTPLIAAMRCFVASKLGEEVAIPEELK